MAKTEFNAFKSEGDIKGTLDAKSSKTSKRSGRKPLKMAKNLFRIEVSLESKMTNAPI
jgi:hypothetical protein